MRRERSKEGSSSSGRESKRARTRRASMAVIPRVGGAEDGSIRKEELVRLLAQAARSIGCESAASQIEETAGVSMEAEEVSKLRSAIEEAEWREAESLVERIAEGTNAWNALLAIRQQEFAELLQDQRCEEAISCLRERMATMRTPIKEIEGMDSTATTCTANVANDGTFDAKLRVMASCVALARKKEELIEALRKGGILENGFLSKEEQRRITLSRVQKALPSGMMLPERRLEELLKNARRHAISQCLYHNVEESKVSLLEDHVCVKEDVLPIRQVAVLESHRDEVWHVHFSHDGKRIASASKDGSACIWRIEKDSQPPQVVLLHRIEGHALPLSYLAWSPDDQWLVTTAYDGRIKLWRTEDGECVCTMQDQTEQVTSCAWMPDGNSFVSGGVDKRTCMWDLQGKTLFKWEGNRVSDLCIVRPPGKGIQLVRACTDKRVLVYDFDTKKETCIQECEAVSSMSVSSDGRYLLAHLSSSRIHLWDLSQDPLPEQPCRTFESDATRSGRYVIRPCFGGVEDRFVASGSEDSQIYLWKRDCGTLLDVLPGHSGTVNALHWCPTDPFLFASASDDRTVRLWGLRSAPDMDVRAWIE